MADKRIYELTEASTVGSSDVLALDSQNMAATKKVKVKTITDPLSNKNDISSLILTGSTNTTGGTIEAGRYFYLDGDLVIAKTNIAAGATFTPGTNYVSATVGGELTDVKQTLSDKAAKAVLIASDSSIFNLIANTNSYPVGKSYYGYSSKFTDGVTSFGNLLNVGNYGIVVLTKYDEFMQVIQIFSANSHGKYAMAVCNKNDTSMHFVLVNPDSSTATVSYVNVSKQTP